MLPPFIEAVQRDGDQGGFLGSRKAGSRRQPPSVPPCFPPAQCAHPVGWYERCPACALSWALAGGNDRDCLDCLVVSTVAIQATAQLQGRRYWGFLLLDQILVFCDKCQTQMSDTRKNTNEKSQIVLNVDIPGKPHTKPHAAPPT